MRKIVHRLLTMLEVPGLGALVTLVIAAAVALRHMIDTPQPLESMLPGTPHIYRWRHGHIFYKTLGNQEAPPLVLLHDLTIGASSYEMRKVVGALAQKYYVYAPDLLGFGLSDRPKLDYSAEIYIDLCHDFLSEVVNVAPTRNATTLLASGLSCNYAVLIAKRYAEICERLVLISPRELFGGCGGRQARWRPPWFSALRGVSFLLYSVMTTRLALRYFAASKIRAMGTPTTWLRRAQPQLYTRLLHGQISGSDVEYLYATTHQFGAEHAPMALLAGKLGKDASQPFGTLRQPVLVIWGARALNAGRDKSGPYISKYHMPENAEMALIGDAGHGPLEMRPCNDARGASPYVHEECPAMVVANILAWGKEDKKDR